MATGLLALLDDIAMLMDDIAVASKIAVKKTSAVLGDDIAVTAKKTTGVASSREIPIILKIIKGSFINKLIIVPVVLILNYFLPWIINPILMIGGLYLAYEGGEKVFEWIFHRKKIEKKEDIPEEKKVKSAIRTDFILSLEIVIIALSSVQNQPFIVQVITTSIVAVLATVGVYGLVALIVRMDDFGFFLISTENRFLEKIGIFLVRLLPKVIKFLSIVGTIAMLLVAGGIYIHSIHILHEYTHFLPSLLSELIVGSVLGFITVGFSKILEKIKGH